MLRLARGMPVSGPVRVPLLLSLCRAIAFTLARLSV